MKNLIIIGAGNFAKIVYDYALSHDDNSKIWTIKGFLSQNENQESNQVDLRYPRNIGSVISYKPEENDVFICAILDANAKKQSIEIIKRNGGNFINLIHKTANISRTASLGLGIFIGAFVTVSADTTINDYTIIQDHCNIGHDSYINEFCNLYVGVLISGKNRIESSVSIFTGSILYPNTKVGEFAQIGAGSVVMRNVKGNTTVLGNPAKKFE